MKKALCLGLAVGLSLILTKGWMRLSFSAEGVPQVSQTMPPPPSPVPPNASRVTASVLNYSVWPPGSLRGKVPHLPLDQTHYSLMLEIHSSTPESPELDSLARPRITIEAFSANVLDSNLVGKKIQAILTLTGDTSGVRWLISNVRAF